MKARQLFKLAPAVYAVFAAVAGSAVAQEVDYKAREAQAKPEIKKALVDLREQIRAMKPTFEVGYTSALDHPLSEITGLKVPPNLAEDARKQNKLARELEQLDFKARNEFLKLNPKFIKELEQTCVGTKPSWDWRSVGKVSPVRDQLGCGSCWAFGTLGAYESSFMIRNNTSNDASEQCVLSCSGAGSCRGGWWAFDFLINQGTAKEAAYPYTASDSACNSAIPRSYRAINWGYVKDNASIPSVQEMKDALCKHGALAIAVRATPAFHAYTAGVFNEHDAGGVNHAITLIGWDDSKHAWLIKNSWNTGWGIGGYMWIAYDSNSVGYAAAWVDAASRRYAIPPGFFKLLPKAKPFIPIPPNPDN